MTEALALTLHAALRMAFASQAVEAIRAARRGAGYDPRQWGWDEELAILATPAMEAMLAVGLREESRRWQIVRPLVRMFGARVVLRKKYTPRPGPTADIAEAARRMSFDFAKSVNATTAEQLQKAYADFRKELVTWAEKGESINQLTGRIRHIVANPKRAAMVATTEGRRAKEAGRLIAAKRAPIRLGKRWQISPTACDFCVELGKDKRLRELDEPFFIEPKEGPYAVCQHAPAHPFCRCSVSYSPL